MHTAYPPQLTDQQLAHKFECLATKWKRETAHLSSGDVICMHPAYQQIIGLGPAAVPLILGDLKREVNHWFWALHSITGENPIPESSYGKMKEMADVWLSWGQEHGLA